MSRSPRMSHVAARKKTQPFRVGFPALLCVAGCKTLFAVDEPPILVDTALPTCVDAPGADASPPPAWTPIAGFGLFPPGTEGAANQLRDNIPVEHVATLGSLVAIASSKDVFAIEREGLYTSDGGTSELKLVPALKTPPMGSDIGRTVYGLAQSDPLSGVQSDSGAPSPAVYVLLCRWQQGCSLEYASEESMRSSLAQPDPGNNRNTSVPCRDREASTDLNGGLGYGCFPFAAPVEGSGFLFVARAVGTDVAMCTTQGTGGNEDRATGVGCRIAKADADGGAIAGLGQQVRPEVSLDEQEERPTALALDQFSTLDTGEYARLPMRLVTPRTLYFANNIGPGGRVQERTDALDSMPPRTITAHDLQPSTTWLAVETEISGETRSAIWHVGAPVWDATAGARAPVTPIFSRKGKIVALTYSPARQQLYWVEEVATATGSERTLFRTRVRVATNGAGDCAQALKEPSTASVPRGLNTLRTTVRILVPPTNLSQGCAEHEELYVLAAKNLWGRPAQGTAQCDPPPSP